MLYNVVAPRTAPQRAGRERLPPDPFPKSILLGAATIMLLTFVAAMVSTPERPNAPDPLRPVASAQLPLSFIDNPDGSISVLDGVSRQPRHLIQPASNGFLRVIMRGLARERRIAGHGPEVPFLLYRAKTDQRLILEDPATGRAIGLDAFGHSNAAVFAALLTTK
jgi:putative photosynthetic complex assembly protein